MKPSHLRTPRSMDEYHFTPGYGPAQPGIWDDFGHALVPWVCAAITIALLVMGYAGWLPGGLNG